MLLVYLILFFEIYAFIISSLLFGIEKKKICSFDFQLLVISCFLCFLFFIFCKELFSKYLSGYKYAPYLRETRYKFHIYKVSRMGTIMSFNLVMDGYSQTCTFHAPFSSLSKIWHWSTSYISMYVCTYTDVVSKLKIFFNCNMLGRCSTCIEGEWDIEIQFRKRIDTKR